MLQLVSSAQTISFRFCCHNAIICWELRSVSKIIFLPGENNEWAQQSSTRYAKWKLRTLHGKMGEKVANTATILKPITFSIFGPSFAAVVCWKLSFIAPTLASTRDHINQICPNYERTLRFRSNMLNRYRWLDVRFHFFNIIYFSNNNYRFECSRIDTLFWHHISWDSRFNVIPFSCCDIWFALTLFFLLCRSFIRSAVN